MWMIHNPYFSPYIYISNYDLREGVMQTKPFDCISEMSFHFPSYEYISTLFSDVPFLSEGSPSYQFVYETSLPSVHANPSVQRIINVQSKSNKRRMHIPVN